MPGGGKKAVFPTLALHDHDRCGSHDHPERPKKLAHQPRSKSESKDSPDKEKHEASTSSSNSKQQKHKNKPDK